MDPASNADYAAGVLESNLNRYGGDVRSALSAYNAGSPNATGTRTDWGDGAPVGYADSVFRHYARLGGDPAAATTTAAAAGSATDPASDPASSLGQLQALASQLGGATGLAAPLNLPPYRPLPQLDGRDRDLAPSADGIGEGDDSMGA